MSFLLFLWLSHEKPPFIGISRKCLTGRRQPAICTDPYTGVPVVQIYRPCCNFYRRYSCIHVYMYISYVLYIYVWIYIWMGIYLPHNVIIAPVIPFWEQGLLDSQQRDLTSHEAAHAFNRNHGCSKYVQYIYILYNIVYILLYTIYYYIYMIYIYMIYIYMIYIWYIYIYIYMIYIYGVYCE